MGLIRFAEGVVINKIPDEMMIVLKHIGMIGSMMGIVPTITGAAQSYYPAGKVHRQGYAYDIRVYDMPKADEFAKALRKELASVSKHYVVLWRDNDENHIDHIHVGFAWAYSEEFRKSD